MNEQGLKSAAQRYMDYQEAVTPEAVNSYYEKYPNALHGKYWFNEGDIVKTNLLRELGDDERMFCDHCKQRIDQLPDVRVIDSDVCTPCTDKMVSGEIL